MKGIMEPFPLKKNSKAARGEIGADADFDEFARLVEEEENEKNELGVAGLESRDRYRKAKSQRTDQLSNRFFKTSTNLFGESTSCRKRATVQPIRVHLTAVALVGRESDRPAHRSEQHFRSAAPQV